jgi:hypothetical protein
MVHTDDPLYREIITSFNDPDPDRALRFKPFYYGRGRRRHAVEVAPPSPGSLRLAERGRELFAAFSRLVMPRRFDGAPCCATPCRQHAG